MKKILILFFIVLSFVSCTNTSPFTNNDNLTAQEFIDKKITKNPVIIDGHNYVLYEYGSRYERNYSFELEHSMKCVKCYENFN